MRHNIIHILFEIIFIICCLYQEHERKIKPTKRMAAVTCFAIVIVAFVNLYSLPVYLWILVYIAIWVYSILEFKDSIWKAFLCLVVTIALGVILHVIAATITLFLFPKLKDDFARNVIISVVALFCIYFVKGKIRLSFIIYWIEEKAEELKIVFVMIAIANGCIFFAYKKDDFMNNNIIAAIAILFIAVCIAISRWWSIHIKAQEEKTKIKMYETYNNAFEELIKGIRERQHEFANQVNAIYGMHATAKTLDGLIEMQKTYCDQIAVENRHNKLLRNGECPVFIGFLYMKFTTAEQKEVLIHYSVMVEKLSSKVPIYEMIELVGILFDNAVETVVTYEPSRRELLVKIDEDDREIFIEIANPCPFMKSDQIEQLFTEGYSTKGENRGLGLAKLKGIVEKYKIDCMVENREYKNQNFIYFKLLIKKL